MSASAAHGADLARLLRWVDAGGEWRVIARTPARLTVALLTCDGGEEMERIDSTDPAMAEYVETLTEGPRRSQA